MQITKASHDDVSGCVMAMRKFWQPNARWITTLEVRQIFPWLVENSVRRCLRDVRRKQIVPAIAFSCQRHQHFIRVAYFKPQVAMLSGWRKFRKCLVCSMEFAPTRPWQVRCQEHKIRRDFRHGHTVAAPLERSLPVLPSHIDDWARLFYSLSLYQRRGIIVTDWPSLSVATGIRQWTLLNTAIVDYENHASSLGIDRLREQCASVGLVERMESTTPAMNSGA